MAGGARRVPARCRSPARSAPLPAPAGARSTVPGPQVEENAKVDAGFAAPRGPWREYVTVKGCLAVSFYPAAHGLRLSDVGCRCAWVQRWNLRLREGQHGPEADVGLHHSLIGLLRLLQ